MLKKVEIEVDDDLVQEVIRRHRLLGTREAVNLALRTLLRKDNAAAPEHTNDEFDEFSDLSAWIPEGRGASG
ncbi:type II toxin-antitoxin system VapB family antitoxin [Mycobacterium sp.]|uniref:type II toxin-antitoxin system VapB family antitoxin n=1 Tax=Mycobacterium sp. TaxID=1785 RepID=UPI003BA87F75